MWHYLYGRGRLFRIAGTGADVGCGTAATDDIRCGTAFTVVGDCFALQEPAPILAAALPPLPPLPLLPPAFRENKWKFF